MFWGCVELDQYPKSSLVPENIRYDEKNIKAFANGLYRALWDGNYSYNCRTQIFNVGADDIVTGMFEKRYVFIDELDINSNLHDVDVVTMWLNMYRLIRQANTMIDILPKTDIVPDVIKNPYIGEAYFMRGFAYFYLVRYFGEVPLISDPNCLTDIYGNNINKAVRASVEDVYLKMIVPDLLKAEELLHNQSRSGDNSTVSKAAAKACLMDVYITMAGWPLKKSEYYAKVKSIGEDLINNNINGYKLVEHYADLWKESNKSSNEEHIFALNHSTTYQMHSNYGRSYYAREEGTSAWSDYLADSAFYERHPLDERKQFNFVNRFAIPGTPRTVDYKNTIMRSPAISKYRDYGTIASAQSSGITPIYRYADVLLMYAEAQNMADGNPNQLSYNCLNRVRERASIGGVYVKAENMDKTTFAKAIHDERGWEFFAEFKRWNHLVRTETLWEANQFNPRVKAGIDKAGITPDNRKVYILPIPIRDVELLGIIQNERQHTN